MKTILHYTLLCFCVAMAVSCSKQNNEVVVSDGDSCTSLSFLLARCDNDESTLAHILDISEEQLHTILNGETEVDSELSERVSSILNYVEDKKSFTY